MTNTGPLSLRECCELIGWTDDDGAPSELQIRKLKRRLRAAERDGPRRLFGGGATGLDCWTTMVHLQELGLVSRSGDLLDVAREGFEAMHQEINELRERLTIIGEQAVDNRQQIAALRMRRRAGLEPGPRGPV